MSALCKGRRGRRLSRSTGSRLVGRVRCGGVPEVALGRKEVQGCLSDGVHTMYWIKFLRVCHVAPMPFPATFGSQVYVGHLCAALSRAGVHVHLACYAGAGEGPEGVTLARSRAVPGAAFATSGPHWSRAVQDLLLARRVSKMTGLDIVHGHNVEGPLVARLARVSCPIVYGQHTAMAEELPQWFPFRGVSYVGRLVDAVVPALSDASIALSHGGEQTLSGLTAVSPPGVHLADLDGADAQRARERYGLAGRPWVVYAGNTDPYQDLDRLFEAMVGVPEAGLLVVTGDAPERWLALAMRLGLDSERVRVVGRSNFSEMKDVLAAATLAVCPRQLCRGFPIKLLNQLALGVPTVCAPGSARPIDGVVVAQDDTIDGLAHTIRDLVRSPGRRKRLSRLAKADIARRWSWDARATDVIRVYERVMANGR